MFLTKIDLDPHRRQARKYLGSPQVMHAVIMKATSTGVFSDDTEGSHHDHDSGRVLWRVDEGAFGTTLYILSPRKPDVTQLEEEAAVAGTKARTLDYQPFLNLLEDEQVWAFRLTANPAYSASMGPGVRGKRFGHVTAEQQIGWLLSRSTRNGFTIIDRDEGKRKLNNIIGELETASVLVARRERPVFSRNRPDQPGKDRVTINRTVYEGILQITNVQTLRHILTNGIGPSKAYGCGLMTLARERRA